MSPAARRAQEHARRSNGEFGNQQHSAPADALGTPAPDGRTASVGELGEYLARPGAAPVQVGRHTVLHASHEPDGEVIELRRKGKSVGSVTHDSENGHWVVGEVGLDISMRPIPTTTGWFAERDEALAAMLTDHRHHTDRQ